MEDKKSELLQYAREYATANKDLYELLSVSADAAQPEVHRAWRKASLKHHPDKAKNFDPEIWQLLERARDVLLANVPYVPSDAVALLPREARDHEPRASLDGGTDGLDVLRALREDPRPALSRVPVVVVTADASDGTEVELLAAGATAVLTKPFNVRQLLGLVDEQVVAP